MDKEVKQLTNKGIWLIVPKLSVPSGKQVINSTWAFKKKWLPDGSVLKYKAQLCTYGDQQVANSDYGETYSPIISWTTVCMLFILQTIYGWQG
jgi:hypothetical protein